MTIVVEQIAPGSWEARVKERHNVFGLGRTADAAILNLLSNCPTFSLSDDRSLYTFEYPVAQPDQTAEQE